MAQPQMGRITCSQCNASYNSERELQEHMKTAHRQHGSEHDTKQDIQPRDEQKPSNS